MQAQPDLTRQFSLGVNLAVELVPGCDHAGVTVVEAGRPHTVASSDEIGRLGDEMQYTFMEGPYLQAVLDQDTVLSPDLTREVRWPRWGPQAHAELGVSSILSLLLYTDAASYGAVNMYADRAGVYTTESIAVAHALAAHLAVAIGLDPRIDQRGAAMVSRTVIGQAEGIVMERLSLTADQAFAYLRRESQQTNTKLITICTDLVATRQLPRPEAGPLEADQLGGPPLRTRGEGRPTRR